MFDEYIMDYYDEIDGQHYVRFSNDLLFLLTFIGSHEGSWVIVDGEWIEGVFYDRRVIARSADV